MLNHLDAQQRQSPGRLLFVIAAVAFVAFVVLNGHGNHLLSVFPLFVLLACPLMHIFMHGGHDQHRGDSRCELDHPAQHPKA